MVTGKPRHSMVFSKLVPICPNPKKDLATPRNQTVDVTISARLRKRNARNGFVAQAPVLLSFPWNEASRAVANGEFYQGRGKEQGRSGCSVCEAVNSRNCTCAAHLAEDMSRRHLSSFVAFVRAPTTPVFAESDPDDQDKLQIVFTSRIPPRPNRA